MVFMLVNRPTGTDLRAVKISCDFPKITKLSDENLWVFNGNIRYVNSQHAFVSFWHDNRKAWT